MVRGGANSPRASEGCATQHGLQISTHMVPIICFGVMGHEHHHRPQLQQAHGPRNGPQQDLGPLCYHGPYGSIGHLGQYGPGRSKATEHQHGLMWLPGPLTSTQPLLVTEAMEINSDLGYCWATDQDMAPGSNPGPEDTMVPCGSTGHPNQHDPGGDMSLRHQHGQRFQLRPWASM